MISTQRFRSVLTRCLPAACLSLALASSPPPSAQAQAAYAFTTDSAPYADLSGATTVPLEFGDSIAVVDLGNETFRFFGRSYALTGGTPLQIGGNGFIQVNDDSVIAIIDAFFTPLAGRPNGSAISYLLDGPQGNRILKVQWKNGGLPQGLADDSVNMQIWLHQASGAIEIRTGPGSVKGPGAYSTGGPWIGTFLAPLTFAYAIEKCWIAGDPAAPRYDTNRTLSFPRMLGRPLDGAVYRLTPRTASDVRTHPPSGVRHGAILMPNPATSLVRVATTAGRMSDVRLLGIDGALLQSARTVSGEATLDLTAVPAGVYLVATSDGLTRNVEKLLKR
ncbi:MAG TPA: T9SS type A sorting domain-containing protein [Candidatus Kapabacteria bacterium]|nr:T9SS type A sorting domain-containing protein [Candidatus Kapabacteria bacterium]